MRRTIFSIIVFLSLLLPAAVATAGDSMVEQLKAGGLVLMIRHAHAPGSGDPANFKIGDCSTQRNLNDQGRAQARRIGLWLRDRGMDSARVYSSQWCRCLETAENLEIGPVVELPALNSHYVTILGISGRGVGSGEGVVLRLNGGDGVYEVLGNLGFGS